MIGRMARTARAAGMIARYGGMPVLLHQLGRQIYSKAVFVGLEKDLKKENPHVACKISFRLHRASEMDIDEVIVKAKAEAGDDVHELIQRKWFWDSGFRECYISRTENDNDLCYLQWLVSRADAEAINNGFTGRLPGLRDDEILIENAYTFRQYRGKMIYPAVMTQLAAQARDRGFKRMLVYVREDNMASLRGCDRAGFQAFERVPERKLLFHSHRKHS